MRSNRPPVRSARKKGRPPKNGTRTSPSPSGGDSTVTWSPFARIAATWSRAYAPIPQWRGGKVDTTRTFIPGPSFPVRPRSQPFDPALHGDPVRAGILLAPHDDEGK